MTRELALIPKHNPIGLWRPLLVVAAIALLLLAVVWLARRMAADNDKTPDGI